MFIIGETPESKPVQGNAALHNLYLYLCTRFGLHKGGYGGCNRPCKQGNAGVKTNMRMAKSQFRSLRAAQSAGESDADGKLHCETEHNLW